MPPGNPTALLSLTDKTGLADLARALGASGYRLVATAGTAAAVRALGLACEDVAALSGQAQLLEGRVKTLQPSVFAGILARPTVASDVRDLQREHIAPICVVAVNLYRFEDTVASGNAEPDALDAIDVGGVALLRAAAKNFYHVSVLADPSLYPEFLEALRCGGPSEGERRRWAAFAFDMVAGYDAAIASYFHERSADPPGVLHLDLPMHSRLRYGENPWSVAAFYHADPRRLPQQHGGKMLSYNNLLDIDSCLRLIAPLAEPEGFGPEAPAAQPVRAAIVKHTVPCGLAAASSAAGALSAALGVDPISAFGGIVAVNAKLDDASAKILTARFLEVVAAPQFDPDALERLRAKKNLRLLTFDSQLPEELLETQTLRSALGGLLMERPDLTAPLDRWTVVTGNQPDGVTWRDLHFAFQAVRQVKSNAAVVVRGEVTLGICGGQTNRVAAVDLACRRAGEAARGAVLATDGFFPFADGIEAAIAHGVAAVVAPSGSIRDREVVAAAQRGGITLVFTTRRYFLH